MPSPRPVNRQTSVRGIILPPGISKIARDHEKHPERGRLLDRINAFSRRRKRQGAAEKKKRRCEKKNGRVSSKLLEFWCLGPDGAAIIGGEIGLSSSDTVSIVVCSGHLVAIDPCDERSATAIVVDIPGMGIVPCRCPIALLGEMAQKEAKALQKRQGDRKKERYSPEFRTTSINSVPANRGDIQGHLLVDADQEGLRGRVLHIFLLLTIPAFAGYPLR